MFMLGAGSVAGGGFSTILIFVVFIGLMYFMMIRPQKKQQNQRKEMMDALKKGDSVITIGGLHGVIDSLNDADKTVTLDCDGVYLVFNRSAIGRVEGHAAVAQPQAAKEVTEETPVDSVDQADDNAEDSEK